MTRLTCTVCRHARSAHSVGGMCDGDGTECYCIHFPDSPVFEAPEGLIERAGHASLRPDEPPRNEFDRRRLAVRERGVRRRAGR